MFTPAIFSEAFRRTIQTWGYHGFLPKPKTSSAQNQAFKLGDNIRNYHAQLQVVRSSFQRSALRLRNVRLPLGPTGFMDVDSNVDTFCNQRHARGRCTLRSL